MKNREIYMVTKMRLKVDAIPEIVNIFKKSENVSCMKGRSHFLMRRAAPFRARKYQDIEWMTEKK